MLENLQLCRMKNNLKVSLVGYMGSGKSAVGLDLATKLNIPFIDLDSWIETKMNQSISELFKTLGEIKFRKLENESLLEILQNESDFVLATGGGTPVYYNNMSMIETLSESFYLRLNPSQLTERLINEKSTRPLIAHIKDEDLPEFIAKHLFERRNFYEKAKYKLDVGPKSIQEISSEIINLLNQDCLQK